METWNRRHFLQLGYGAAMSVGGLAQAKGAESPNGVVDLDLEAKQQWFRIGGGRALLYGYNGQIPGPVVEARPGDHVRLRFRNSLGEPTNVHYHGLHVPPTGSADNSFLMIAPGEEFTYEFDLPAWHPGGTFWYHPHVHGLTARQVSRGLAGVFIVRGELDRIEEIAAAPESILVLQDFDLGADGVAQEPDLMERMMGRQGG